MKPKINLIITDLDDTIWDWLEMWHSSFEPYFKRIAKEYNIPEEILAEDFKRLHQKYNTTEASFIVDELKSLSLEQRIDISNSGENEKSILHEYNSNKKSKLELYGGVLESLRSLKMSGCKIIGFTESKAFFTKYRIKHLQLDGLFDCIYAPVDFELPESVTRHYDESYWEPNYTEFRYLPKTTKKPAPEILDIIIKDFKGKKESSIYIGDKLDRDIYMANQANVKSVYASYGQGIHTKEYELLKNVTHWTDEDVEREAKFSSDESINPIANYTLENSFDEIFSFFEFFEFQALKIDNAQIDNVISIWKQIIDVQQHFNDIALRIKNIALTVFTFIIGAIGYSIKENLSFVIWNIDIDTATMLSLFGIIIMFAFFYMDRFWYHNLLLGSVKQGMVIEKRWGNILPEINLTHAIGKASPHPFLCGTKIHSNGKFYIFYGLLIAPLLVMAILTLFI